MKTKTLIQGLGLSLALIVTAACGKSNNWVRDVDLTTYQQNGSSYGTVSTYINTGGIRLPAMSAPIVNPKNMSQLGAIAIRPSTKNGATEEIAITINISEAAKMPGLGANEAVLPNGNPLPVAGYDPKRIMVLKVPGKNITVYLDMDTVKDHVLVGVAIPVKEMDQVGGKIGGADLFQTFDLKDNVQGTFGVFTGPQAGQNGFALFIQADGLIKELKDGVKNSNTQTLAQNPADPLVTKQPYDFQTLLPGARKTKVIDQRLYELSQSRSKLRLH